MLSVALGHLEAAPPDLPAALVALLEAWRRERSPRIAALIDRVSERITAGRAPIAGKTLAARTANWVALSRSRDPSDLGVLLATPWPKQWRPALDVCEHLLAWPDDPRIAAAFAGLVVAATFKEKLAHHVYATILDGLARLRDPRVVEILASRPVEDRAPGYGYVTDREARLVASLRDVRDEVSDATSLARLEALFVGVTRATTAGSRSDAEFLAAIHAAPDDDDLRRVFADVLSERGDVRGELVASQLAPGESPARAAREKAWIEAHGAAWAGPLDAWLEQKGRVFERGFLGKGRLRPIGARRLPEVLAAPEWSTVRALTVPFGLWDELEAIVASPTLRGLRALDDLPAMILPAVGRARAAGHLPRLEALSFHAGTFDQLDRATLRAALGGLRHLTVTFVTLDHLEVLAGVGVLEGLSSLTVATGEGEAPLPAWWDRVRDLAGQLRTFVYQPSLPAHPDDRVGMTYELEHVEGQRLGRLRAVWTTPSHRAHPMPGLIAALAALAPDRLREVVVVPARAIAPTDHERAAIEAALAANVRLTRVDVPWPRETVAVTTQTPPDGPCRTIELFGEPLKTTARIGPLFATAAELGLAFDTFVLGGDRRPLGRDPVKTLTRAATKRGVRSLRLFRDGDERAIEVEGDDWDAADVPTQRTTLILDGFAARADRTFAWLYSFFERFAISHGVGARTEHELVPLSWLDATSSHLGWFTVFGPHHEALLPRSELAALAAVGAEVRCLSRNVLVLWAEGPDDALDEARAQAIDAVLRPIVERGIARKLGYDFGEVVGATLGPALEAEGYVPVPQRWDGWPNRFLASWVQRRPDVDRSIDVSLEGLATVPRLGYWLRKHEIGEGAVGSGRQLSVCSYLPPMAESCEAATREALGRSCRALLEHAPAYFDP